jgi:glucose-1-phosphate thymidylyltransferase
MKGVILAGGTGTRLYPSTKVTNKHLLNVYDRPMIYFPLRTLVDTGIDDILIVTGGEHQGDIAALLGSGKGLEIDGKKDGRVVDVNITYMVQDRAGGIAEALGLAKDFVGNQKFMTILGDNIFENDVSEYVTAFMKSDSEACVLLKEVDDARRFGVAEIKDGKLVGIEEKPEKPKSNLAVTGLYMYDPSVFYVVRGLKPSERKELEISDVNSAYIQRGTMMFHTVKGNWTDAGTPESLYRAATLVRERELKKS